MKFIRLEKIILDIKFTLTKSIMMKDWSQQQMRRLTRHGKKATSNCTGVGKKTFKTPKVLGWT
jgi:hypothetical protein